MLAVASPISLPSPTSFARTSKDADSSQQLQRGSGIDAILQDTVEFVEGSSTGALAQVETKYPYINASNDESSRTRPASPSRPPPASPSKLSLTSPALPAPHAPRHPLHDRPIVMSWLMTHEISAGFINTGNTCFLNSVLQCLIHTAPLQRLLAQHGTSDDKCSLSDAFCMTCKLRAVMEHGFKNNHAWVPAPVLKNLNRIAKHMRLGRQEDAHEFLRYSVDALQRACLGRYASKVDPKIAETTWVHKLFGGRLRSRVTCQSCSHPSDTFDAILDLSLDIQNVGSLKQALAKFVQVDHLRGANKYKCERCKRAVNAEKQFTVHDAPVCLTVHLKRFTPLGRKIGHTVEYGHTLDLQPAMSEGQRGLRYNLYGVISHVGGGPNSGHYYAHVRGPDGYWYEANDESVTRCAAGAVIGRKSAYMLFYMRQRGDVLGEAIGLRAEGLVGMKKGPKRKSPMESDDDEDRGVRTNGSAAQPSTPKRHKPDFIGPRLPSPAPPPPPRPDPQAILLQAKIAKAKASKNISLVSYSSDAEEEEGELPNPAPPRSSPVPDALSPPSSATVGLRSSSPIAPASFYGQPPLQPKKRKSIDEGGHDLFETRNGDTKRRRPSPPSEIYQPKRSLSTPFTSSSMSNNLHASRDGQGLNGQFNPPNRGPKQRIALVGSFTPKNKGGYATNMKKKPPKSMI